MENLSVEHLPYLNAVGNFGWKLNPATVGCHNPDHDPPLWMLLIPGFYAHVCPGCKDRTVFSVSH